MSNNCATNKSFSIFDPSIRYEHREFYERIISELNGILPVCNQGESTAVDISENITEQEQITELMKRVENFSEELLVVTKKLFDQYYVAKEALYQAILNTTAYNKINTLDRNLLERTCDVRWWALETAFSDCIRYFELWRKTAHEAHNDFNSVSSKKSVSAKKTLNQAEINKTTKDESSETENSILTAITASLDSFSFFLQPVKQTEILNTFQSGISDALLSTAQKNRCKFIYDMLLQLQQKITYACDRLEDINNSYTLYRDLIITTSDGFVVANSNISQRSEILGTNVHKELWFKKSLETKNGTEYFAQDLCSSSVENQLSLVYSTAIRENSDENGTIIGTMGVFFDFQGEAQIILEEYMPRDNDGQILDGCYSMFTSEHGIIIASNDERILEVGKSAHIPRKNRNLSNGQHTSSYIIFEGVDSAIYSAKTDGYLDYKGLGWSSHVIIPKSYIFNNAAVSSHYAISSEDLMNSKIIPEINKQTYLKVQDDKESIQLISLNGIVFASKLGKRGAALGPIFNQITKSGDFVTSRMEDLLKEMALGELDLNLKALENFSKQAIDLIDRNLFERSADIRWWATDQYFWNSLLNPSEDNHRKASERLKVINGSYTMYRNIILANSSGEIVSCSRMELKNELQKINVSDQSWFQQGMRTTKSSEYAVQDIIKSNLEKSKERSLIYSGGVRKNGNREDDAIGVLGILFDWDTEAKKILSTCLPKDPEGQVIEGSVAFYTNHLNEIIETTDEIVLPIGLKLILPPEIQHINAGETISGSFTFNNRHYIIGSSKTKGYREYRGLNWSAHIIRPID
jgi:hypothetical protein